MEKIKVNIRFPKESDLKENDLEKLCKLINKVYDDAESGMWKHNAQRVNVESVLQMLKNNALLIAETDNKVVGCANINLFDDKVAEFGMLVADPDCRGMGIGRELVKAAESWALDNNRMMMRLELLTPKNWEHPNKEFLKKWYTRIGYSVQSTEPFEKLHPDKINNLVTPCDFTIYHKKLNKISRE